MTFYIERNIQPLMFHLYPASPLPDDFIIRNNRMKTKKNLLDNFLNPHSDLFKPDALHLFGVLESLNHHTLISVQCLSCVVGCFSLLVSHTCL